MRADLLRLGRNTVIYGAGNVLMRAVSLLLLPVFTSYLTPLDYGISSILGVLTFFLTPVFALGLSGALGIVYFESADAGRRAATIWTAVAILVASGATLAAAGTMAGGWIAGAVFAGTTAPYDLGYLVVLALLTAAMSIISQPLLLYLQFEERAKTFVAITAGNAALSIGLSVILIVVLGRGVAGFIEAGLAAQATTLAVTLLIGIRRLGFALRLSVAGELLRLGVPLIPSFIAIFVMQQANKFILQEVEGLSAVGVYTIGFNIGLVITLVVSGFTSAWFPFFSSYMERQEKAPPVFARVLTYYVIGAGTLSLFFFVLARSAVLLLTQPNFHEAYVAIGPSAAAQMLVGVHSILLAGLYLARDVRYGVVIQWSAAIASLALNIILIGLLGILGGALALMLSFAIMVVLQYLWNRFRRYLEIAYEWRRIGAFAALYVVTAALSLVDRDWPLGVEIGVSAVACLAIMSFAFAILSPRERSELLSAVRRIRGTSRPQPGT